jgi:hypothetical protein
MSHRSRCRFGTLCVYDNPFRRPGCDQVTTEAVERGSPSHSLLGLYESALGPRIQGRATARVSINHGDLQSMREARDVHQGNCPKCEGPDPVDVHMSHKVHSVLVMTYWSSHPIISCRSCGRKRQLKHAIYSFFLGW